MQNQSPKEIIYKGKLRFDSPSHMSLEKLLNFRWREQNTLSSHIDLLLKGLLGETRPKNIDEKSKREKITTGGKNTSLLKLINSDEFTQLTHQTEHSGWKSLINQIKINLNSSG